MPNPKAPRIHRSRPPEPRGAMLPVRRMRRVGASDEIVDYWQQVWEHLPETERDALRAAWRRLPDDALADELGVEHSPDEFPDPAEVGNTFEPVDDALLGVPDGAPQPEDSADAGPGSDDEGRPADADTGEDGGADAPANTEPSSPGPDEGEQVEGELGVTLDEVPEGTVDDVLGWVRKAGDPDLRRARARAALDVENERTNAQGQRSPRVTVTDALREVAGG